MSKMTPVFITACLFICASASFAEEKREGFIKRLFKLPRDTVKAVAGPVSGEKEKMPAPREGSAPAGRDEDSGTKKPPKTMTTEEFAIYLKETLDSEDGVLSSMPELKKDEGGFYTYNGVRLEELDREKLDRLYGRVQNEVVTLRTERLSRQFESIRQAQQADMAARQASRIPVVHAPPPQPPRVPQPPPSVPQAPKVPPQPPTPPRR